MSLTAAASGLVVFLLSVSVVQGLDGWGMTCSSTEICAVKGSTLEINCSYTYRSTWDDGENTGEKTFWFTKKEDGERVDLTTDAEYAGRVEDLCENNICTLRIRNLTESDSAEYRFMFTTNLDVYWGHPVTLSVTDLQLQPLPDQGQREQQDDLQYSTVHFSNNRAEPLYSNMRAGQHLGHTEPQEATEYAAVNFTSCAPRTRPEDPAELYSVITKIH
ncbi:hypothetical protein KUCAC02_031724 [Chaenocephalus aceratus]|nr:hypothetical protein KUCAC02_031724 [Chaenocephalus aceratus]